FNNPTSKTIKLPTTTLVFHDVLSFVIDDHHPFPLKYSYELDFYGVKYEKERLYDENKMTKELIRYHFSETNKLLGNYNKNYDAKLDIINNNLSFIENMTSNLYKNGERFCGYKKCTDKASAGDLYCLFCTDKSNIFLIKDCTTKPVNSNYCDIHQNSGRYCVSKNCSFLRIKGQLYCFQHK